MQQCKPSLGLKKPRQGVFGWVEPRQQVNETRPRAAGVCGVGEHCSPPSTLSTTPCLPLATLCQRLAPSMLSLGQSVLQPSSSPLHLLLPRCGMQRHPKARWDGLGYPTLLQRAARQAPVNTALPHTQHRTHQQRDQPTPASTPSDTSSVGNDRSTHITPFSQLTVCLCSVTSYCPTRTCAWTLSEGKPSENHFVWAQSRCRQ